MLYQNLLTKQTKKNYRKTTEKRDSLLPSDDSTITEKTVDEVRVVVGDTLKEDETCDSVDTRVSLQKVLHLIFTYCIDSYTLLKSLKDRSKISGATKE